MPKTLGTPLVQRGMLQWPGTQVPGIASSSLAVDAQTVLLLHGEALADSSFYGHPITTVGTPFVDSAQSVFGGASVRFQGAPSALITPDSADWAFGTGDFTVDFWARFSNVADQFQRLLAQAPVAAGNTGWWVDLHTAPAVRFVYSTDGTNGIACAAPLTYVANTWYHVAFVRSGGTLYGFVNGSLLGTQPIGAAAIFDSTAPLYIGGREAGTNSVIGWLDEVRISKGIARWTSNFTPPAAPYSSIDASTVLLLHGESLTDAAGHPLTANGGAAVSSAQSKFGGSSLFFDGVDDMISFPDSPDWTFGTGEFTAECWANFSSPAQVNQVLIGQFPGVPGQYSWLLRFNPPNIQVYWSADGTTIPNVQVAFAPVAGTWYHFAVVRTVNSLVLFVNGVSVGSSGAVLTTLFDSNVPLTIGGNPGGGWPFSGYMDEVRISKGIARWTANFTPPAAPYV